MRLAIFDLDHTLLAGDSDFLWGRFLVELGLVDAGHYARENQRFYEAYVAGTLDIEAFARFSLKPLTQHPLPVLQQVRARFMREKIEPVIAPGAEALLREHRERGELLLITTATNAFITAPIAERLGVDALIATEPEMQDGRYTGRLAGIPNFQAGKVQRLRSWMAQQGIEACTTTCYSDSRNDLPLLEFADEAVAVDPDPVLRAEAQRRGWRIISLREPRVQ